MPKKEMTKKEAYVLIGFFFILGIVLAGLGNLWGLILVFLSFFLMMIVPWFKNLVFEFLRSIYSVAKALFSGARKYQKEPSATKAVPTESQELAISSPVNDIIEKIKQYKPHYRPSKERALEDMLVTHLRVWYPNVRTELFYEKARIDAQIGRIGIEIKLSPDEGELDRLYGQIDKYLDHLDTVIAVIFFERSRESTESFMRRLVKRGWLNDRVFVLSL